ncbi:TylF/MycF/NovP-related O-methyltransferase [Ornithinibacillus sp. 179-J 7C1 HS]|uniref:TylF/MycF/NovP-related O-methyltransferase n=1 Tax=Ornithinibacillus sp. 179-J 7C1 HS TaxID=3142384 RepID=UPI00399F23F0
MILKYDESKAFDYENGFILTSEVYRLGNILSHYELYKKIIGLPGDVIELGVFKGNSLLQFASFRELLENEKSRKIIGFDVFGEFPKVDKIAADKAFVNNWNKIFEGDFLSQEDLYKSLQLKGIGNVSLIKGNILETLPKYLEENSHTKISLLHIDTDVYEPSKLALELLFDRVVSGGLIVFDDYGTVEGETRAVDEFLLDKEYQINKLTLSHVKPSFIIKK